MRQYILLRNKTFYYRRRIPKEYVDYFPLHNEIRLKLVKKSLKTAILEAKKINLLFEELLLTLQLDTFGQKEQIVNDYISLMKDAYKEMYFTGKHNGMLNRANLEYEQLACEQSIKSGVSHLASSQIEDVLHHAHIDPKSIDNQTYKQIESLYLHKKIGMLEEMIHVIDPRRDFQSSPSAGHIDRIADTGITFKELYELFLKEKKRTAPDLAPSTRRDYESAYADFLFVIEGAEDRDIASFTKEDFRTFVDSLHDHLPSSRTKKREYRNLSYAELLLIDLPSGDKMAHETKKKKISAIKQMFDIAIDARFEYLSVNHAQPFLLNTDSDQQEERKPLSPENLDRLFSSKYFTTPKIRETKPHQFWIPIIALFTGLRQNEICQLYCDDVRFEDIEYEDGINRIWYFDINEELDKHLKNKNAIRLVPIHPKLIELSFLDYFVSVKEKHERLWPQLRLHPKEQRYNTDYNKVFMKFFRTHITIDPSQVFHSLRHNVGSQLVKNAVHHKLPKDLMNQIMGHEPDKDMTTAVYSEGYGIKELYEGISTLNFQLINIILHGMEKDIRWH